MKYKLLLSCLSFALGLSHINCSADSAISIVFTNTSIPADPHLAVPIVANVISRGSPAPDGRDVTFSVDRGSFSMFEDIKTTEVETLAGQATTTFFPPNTAGTVSLTANFTTPNKDVVSDNRIITIGNPTPVSAFYFEFDCEFTNVGAYISGIGEIRVPCTVITKDRYGNPLPFAQVQFAAEAGYFEQIPYNELSDDQQVAFIEQGQQLFSYVVRSNASPPADVVPILQEEELAQELGLALGSNNPRDGLVTIVAYVYGEEYLIDNNDNGQRDPGEAYWDEGEPFLDVDDDGYYLEEPLYGIPRFDWFADNNNNNALQPDGPNGTWDTGVTIGRVFRILWTGEPDTSNSSISPANISFCACGSEDFNIRIMDKNMNPPAATRPDRDGIDISPPSNSKVGSTGAGEQALRNDHYMEFGTELGFIFMENATFQRFVTGGSPTVFTGREWIMSISDDRSPCLGDPESDCSTDSGNCKAVTGLDIEVQYDYTPNPDSSTQLTFEPDSVDGGILNYFDASCPGG